MKTLLTIISCFLFSFLFGQTKSFNNVTYSNGDTSFWYKYQQIVIKQLSLKRIDTSSTTYYFRLWTANQVLDVWQNIDYSLSGQLTTWVTEQTPSNEKDTDRVQIAKVLLKNDTVKLIQNLIEKTQILKLPTDDSIKGWKQGFDGITYIIESASKTSYDFKTYWTPNAQDSTLQESKIFQAFVDTLFKFSNANNIWTEFQKTIPFECYSYSGFIVCKVLTKKERKKFIKERKNYRQHQLYASRATE
jgi:hypothetical protein